MKILILTVLLSVCFLVAAQKSNSTNNYEIKLKEPTKKSNKESKKSFEDPNRPCPSKCTCLNGVVNCQKAGLTEIPSNNEIPANTKEIDLTNNQIKRLSKFDRMLNLTKLILKSNHIQNVEPEAFESSPNLQTLDLSFNREIRIHSNLFNPLKDLKSLNLEYCNISKIDPELFHNNSVLSRLDLNSNPLSELDSHVFKHLKLLEYLDLSNTKLKELKIREDSQLNHLKTLNLSYNELRIVASFRYAPNIETLILNNNKIQVMNKDTFLYLKNLKNLEITHNDELLDIEELTFSQQTKLKRLVISNNANLFLISQHAFYGSYNRTSFQLKELILHKNSFHFISEKLLENHWGQLSVLDLRGNPLKCDCHLSWLLKYQNLSSVSTLRCRTPENLERKYLKDIEHKDFICPKLIDPLLYDKLRNVLQSFVFAILLLICLLAFLLLYVIQDRPYSWMRMFGTSSLSSIYYQKANTKEHPILY